MLQICLKECKVYKAKPIGIDGATILSRIGEILRWLVVL